MAYFNPSSALRRLYLVLTGGAEGCSRRRFFISMAIAVPVLFFGGKLHVASQIAAYWQMDDHPVSWLLPLLSVLCVPCLFIGSVCAGIFDTLFSLLLRALGICIELPLAEFDPQGGGYIMGSGLPPWCFFLSVFLVLFSTPVVFGLTWRRLKDAGLRPLHLLAGLWYFMVNVLFLFGWLAFLADSYVLTFIVNNLGGLWLLYQYGRPSRKETAP